MTDLNTDLLLDLSPLAAEPDLVAASFANLASRDVLGEYLDRATVLLPANFNPARLTLPVGWSALASAMPILDANTALESAGDRGHHLLVMLGPQAVSNEAIGLLLAGFSLDPHFGITVPRQCNLSGEVLKLAEDLGDPQISSLPRRALVELPDYYILPELNVLCFVLRDEIVSNLSLLDESHDTLNGALQHYLCHVRRAGYRTAVINRAAIQASPDVSESKFLPSKADTRKLHIQHPDVGRAKSEFIEDPLHLHESLLARAFSTDIAISQSLLIDGRGIRNYINGTAEAILALCDALKNQAQDWNISLLAEATAIDHHNLAARYPGWRTITKLDDHFFTIALRPSQPWHIGTMSELHGVALLNFYAMLDTIAWDILTEAPRGLAAYWDFMCQYADGLLYNSSYTRNHFTRRFPLASSTPGYVFHHSFNPEDYVVGETMPPPAEGDYIFVIGNTYDHKNLKPTVDLLTSTFPFQQIKVLGLASHPSPQIDVLESGNIPASEIETLFSRAKLVVFPSLYEGFGLPVLKGLSYGRTVLARHSDLLLELAAHYQGPGALLAFTNPFTLVDLIGRVLHDQPVASLPFGGNLSEGEKPLTWSRVAHGLMRFLELRKADVKSWRWVARERAIRQLNAFCS